MCPSQPHPSERDLNCGANVLITAGKVPSAPRLPARALARWHPHLQSHRLVFPIPYSSLSPLHVQRLHRPLQCPKICTLLTCCCPNQSTTHSTRSAIAGPPLDVRGLGQEARFIFQVMTRTAHPIKVRAFYPRFVDFVLFHLTLVFVRHCVWCGRLLLRNPPTALLRERPS